MIEEIIGYIRVSSREQANDTNALEQQRARVIEAGAKQIFEDVQKGRGKKRHSFDQMIKLVKRGKIRKIIITRIDRITRSLVTLKKLVDTLEEYGVSLVILDQKMDLSTAQGKMVLNVLGTLAEWEVDLLSERVQHGKKHQRDQKWANGSCPWAYEVVDHRYVLDQTPFLCLLSDRPDNYVELSQKNDLSLLPRRTIAELARDCIDIFFAKKGARRALKVIFEKYGIVKTSAKFNGSDKVFYWSARGFTLWLKNTVLDGHTSYIHYKTVRGKRIPLPQEDWEIIKDTHPEQRLFRDGEAAAVQTIFKINTCNASGAFQRSLTGTDNYRPFTYQTGLIYCQECGSRCTPKGNSANTDYLYYACRHAGVGCDNHKAVRRRNIEESLIEALVEKSHSLNQEESMPNTILPVYSEALVRLEEQLAGLERISGFNPAIEELKHKLQQQIEEEKNPFLSEDKMFDSSVEDLIRAGNNLAIWHLLDNDEKVEIYGRLVHKIYIQDGKIVSVVFNK
ncbi:MAG TPA: fdxN element excision recombinase XisF [Coleofasciculaceae cyanobacterium]|jgi:DNA invertase Pin-like site-specific DNA recombinase